MNYKNLGRGAAKTLANVDTKAAAGLASSILARVSVRNSNPTVRTIAGLVAQGLADAATPPPSPAAPGASPPPTTDGWQRALSVLGEATPEPAKSPTSQATRPRRAAPPANSSRGLLTGFYDAANIGRFGFALMNGVQLQVGVAKDPGNVGGQFWLADLQPGTWYQLKDRGARMLPVWVQWRDQDLHVLVGDGPGNAPVIAASDMRR